MKENYNFFTILKSLGYNSNIILKGSIVIDMKKISFIVSAVLIALLSGCAGTFGATNKQAPQKAECMQDGMIAPVWVCKPEVADAFASLGVAQNSGVDKAQTVKNAISNGREELVKQIEPQIREKLANFILTPEGKNKEKVDELVASIMSKINPKAIELPQTLKSSSTPSGKVNVHVIASKESIEAEIKRAVILSQNNDRAAWLGFNSKLAIAHLEKDFGVVMSQERSEKVKKAFREEIVTNSIVGRNKRR